MKKEIDNAIENLLELQVNHYDCDIHPGTKLHCPSCNGLKGGASGGVARSIKKLQSCRENVRKARAVRSANALCND